MPTGYKVGQRVMFTYYSGKTNNTGVISIPKHEGPGGVCYGIIIDEPFRTTVYKGGHDLDGKLPQKGGWWVRPEMITGVVESPYTRLLEKLK